VIVGVGAAAGYGIARAAGWHAVWANIPAGCVLGGLPGIAVGLYVALRIAHGKHGTEFLRWVLGTPSVLVLMIGFMGANFVALVPLVWLPKFVFDKFHVHSLALAALGATFPIQAATMVGAPLGGFFADLLRRRTVSGRMIVQACALIIGAPFVYWAGSAPALAGFLVAITLWGLLKGMYDANIFASAFDVVPPQFRATAAGFMNMAGWLGGGFPGPIVIGFIAAQYANPQKGLSVAIESASWIYLAAGVVIILGALAFAKRDAARMERELAAAPAA
jgi:MFS family permease